MKDLIPMLAAVVIVGSFIAGKIIEVIRAMFD